MKKLEFAKSRYDFEKMMDEGVSARYRSEEYFPKDVSFKEADMPIDFKNEALSMTSETLKEGQVRGLSLIQRMNVRLDDESIS